MLFNPQRAADPVAVAAGFAILLLPYSLVGPFAGVWLDRWSRRQVLVRANLLRAGLVAVVAALVLGGVQGTAFYAAGLAVFSVNRFVLAALSAGLPAHHRRRPPSCRRTRCRRRPARSPPWSAAAPPSACCSSTGSGDGGYAALALSAALPYLAAAAVVAGFGRADLGPDHRRPLGAAVGPATSPGAWWPARGTPGRARRPPPRCWRSACTGSAYGLLTLMTLLLYRNTFAPAAALFPGGMVGLGEVVAAGAVGTLLAAVVTPGVVRRIGKPRWITLLLVGAGVTQVGLGLPFLPPTIVLAGLVLGLRLAGGEDLRGHDAAGVGRGRLPRPGVLRLRHPVQRHVRRGACWWRVRAAALGRSPMRCWPRSARATCGRRRLRPGHPPRTDRSRWRAVTPRATPLSASAGSPHRDR